MHTTTEFDSVQGERQKPPLFTFDGRGSTLAHLIRYWMAHVQGSEFKILMFLYGQLLGYRQRADVWITRKQFAEGIRKKDGTIWHRGTGLSPTAIDSALHSLEHEKKAIFVRREETEDMIKCWYRFNPEWDGKNGKITDEKPPRKKGRASPQCEARHPESWGQKEENEKETIENNSAEPSASAELAFRNIKITARNRTRLRQETDSKTPLSDERLSAEKISAIWDEAFRTGFPGVPFSPLKQREVYAILAYSKRFSKGGFLFTFETLLRWSIKNWSAICSDYFRRMRCVPNYPSVLFMVSLSDRFEQAYVFRERVERKLLMTSKDAAIARLTDLGMPYEVAEREWKEKTGMARRERAVEKREADIKNKAIRAHVFAEQRVQMILKAQQRQNQPLPERAPIKVKDVAEIDLSGLPDRFPPFRER